MAFGYDGSVRIKADMTTRDFDKGISSMSNTLKRFGKMVLAAFSTAAIVNFAKEAIDAASSLSNAWQGLQSIVEGQGRSFGKAKSFIEDYISDGLVPLENAVTAYKNLAARGYDDEQIQKTLVALKDAAAFGRQASYSLGDAVTSATEGLKNENSILVDNAGVTKNVAKMWDEYAKSIGTTANNLTQEQKIQAEVNGILEETRFQTGDAAKVAGTYSGQVASLGYNFQNLKVAVGNAMIPIAQAVLPSISAIIAGLTKLANVFAAVTSLLFGKSTATAGAASTQNALATTGGAAADSANELADAEANAGSAAKQAGKDMKGVLAGFDELNILADNTAGSLEDASGGLADVGGGEIALPEVDTSGELFGDVEISPNILKFVNDLEAALEPARQALSRLWDELKRLGGFAWDGLKDFYETLLKPLGQWVMGEGIPRFVDAITNGLALVDWQNINDSLHTLWIALEPFAEHVGEGLLWLWENVLLPFGTWTANDLLPEFLDLLAAAIDLLDTAIVELQPYAIWLWDNFLKPIAEWTGGVIIDVLHELTDLLRDLEDLLDGDISFEDFIGQLTPLQTALLGLAAAFGLISLAGTVGNAITAIKGFADTITSLNAVGLIGKLGEVIALVADGAGNLHEAMSLVFGPGSIIAGIAAIVGGAVLAVTNFVSMLKDGFSWAKEALMLVGIAITALGAVILGLVSGPVALAIAAVVAAVATAVVLIKEHWEEIKQWFIDAWEKIKETASKIADWFDKNVIQPVGKFFSDLWNGIKTFASDAWDKIKEIWNTVSTWFNSNVIQPVGKFFSGLWNDVSTFFSNAWESIKSTAQKISGWLNQNVINPIKSGFKSFVNSLIGFAEGFVNFFIRGINNIIGAFNKINVNIPDWVPGIGGENFGINISKVSEIKLPRLANGAVIPPNQQFAAILGDQRSGKNIEAPAGLIENIVSRAVSEAMAAGGKNQPIQVNVMLDKKVLARAMVREVNDMTRAAGRSVLDF